MFDVTKTIYQDHNYVQSKQLIEENQFMTYDIYTSAVTFIGQLYWKAIISKYITGVSIFFFQEGVNLLCFQSRLFFATYTIN